MYQALDTFCKCNLPVVWFTLVYYVCLLLMVDAGYIKPLMPFVNATCQLSGQLCVSAFNGGCHFKSMWEWQTPTHGPLLLSTTLKALLLMC